MPGSKASLYDLLDSEETYERPDYNKNKYAYTRKHSSSMRKPEDYYMYRGQDTGSYESQKSSKEPRSQNYYEPHESQKLKEARSFQNYYQSYQQHEPRKVKEYDAYSLDNLATSNEFDPRVYLEHAKNSILKKYDGSKYEYIGYEKSSHDRLDKILEDLIEKKLKYRKTNLFANSVFLYMQAKRV